MSKTLRKYARNTKKYKEGRRGKRTAHKDEENDQIFGKQHLPKKYEDEQESFPPTGLIDIDDEWFDKI